MKLHELKERKCDGFGCGFFGASRGSRTHNGVDLLAGSGVTIRAPISGVVSKIGYPYGDDLSYRYVQISEGGYDFRIFYISPMVKLGDHIEYGTVIGKAQDLDSRYEGIPNHVHFEIKKDGRYVDPTPTLIALRNV